MVHSLVELPEELLANVAALLENDSLCSLRLTCKHLHLEATRAMFSFARLYSSDDTKEILAHPELQKHLKHIELNTHKRSRNDGKLTGMDLIPDYEMHLGLLTQFSKLKSATLRYTDDVYDYTHRPGPIGIHLRQIRERDYQLRSSIVASFFKALAEPSASKIKDICLENILNVNDREFMRSERVLPVLSRLNALRLYIITEHHTAVEECGIATKELHQFMGELRHLWLEPASNSLTTLVLYQDFHFGVCPKLDLDKLHFPSLRTLALGNYVFMYDWQIHWLSRHSRTLRNLYLDNCTIVYYSKLVDCTVDADNCPVILVRSLDEPGPGPDPTPPLFRRNSNFHDQTWSRIFNHLRTTMLALRHFRIGKSTRFNALHSDDDSDPLAYENLAIGLFPDRYLMFHMGIEPYPYVSEIPELRRGQTVEGDMALDFKERFFEQDFEDVDALERLLKALGQPIPRDTEDVVGLLGSGPSWVKAKRERTSTLVRGW